MGLGWLIHRDGNSDLAIEYFLKAIKLNPEYELAYFNLGTMQDKLGKTKEFNFSFKPLDEFSKNNSSTFFMLLV